MTGKPENPNEIAWLAGFVVGYFLNLALSVCAVLVAFAWRLT